MRLLTLALIVSATLACRTPAPLPEQTADAIYANGPIVTMAGPDDRAEALAVKDGKIMLAGRKEAVMKTAGPQTTLVDLHGHALLPGFIDPHSHVVMQSAKFSTVNLDPYPIGDVKSIADIQRKLREWIAETKPAPGGWVVGWGYDDTGVVEMRHPNRDDLDAVSTEHPILLIHISSHLLAVNSKALELAGVRAATPDPPGGRFQRKAGSRVPNGIIEEQAMLALVKALPVPDAAGSQRMLERGLNYYAAEGITTAQDGAAFPGARKLVAAMAEAGRLPIDVVSYPVAQSLDRNALDGLAGNTKLFGASRTGGIKLVVDGSIQGYTAYLSQPYFAGTPSAAEESACESDLADRIFVGGEVPPAASAHPAPSGGNRGYPSMTQHDLNAWVKAADEAGVQLLVHCNGDAAVDMLLEAIRASRGDRPRPDLRTVIIHAQTMRDDQLDQAAAQGLITSFFPIHVVFWGDRHRDLFLGPERAARINPARSALDRGIRVTLHHDAPIAQVGMLPVVAAAVNRITTSGKLLGPEQRITAFEALRAITRDAAYQYFEENRKGTLEAGKLADMVILDADPLAVDPLRIGNIKVLETIKAGKTVFKR